MRSPLHFSAVLPLLLGGCVAMPFASPPMQLQVAGGIRQLDSDTIRDRDVPVQVRAGVHPLSLFPKLIQRRGDFALGYLLDYGTNTTLNGAYLEASVNMLTHGMSGGFGRLSARGQARLIYAEPEQAWGQSGALQFAWEYVTFTDSDFENTNDNGGAFGHAYGEGGIGLYLEGSYLRAGTLHGWTATAGLTIRIPAAYGISYVWAWALAK
ncbi:MAG: hypothetical protein QM765_07585 [Myxococcales bacterium]